MHVSNIPTDEASLGMETVTNAWLIGLIRGEYDLNHCQIHQDFARSTKHVDFRVWARVTRRDMAVTTRASTAK